MTGIGKKYRMAMRRVLAAAVCAMMLLSSMGMPAFATVLAEDESTSVSAADVYNVAVDGENGTPGLDGFDTSEVSGDGIVLDDTGDAGEGGDDDDGDPPSDGDENDISDEESDANVAVDGDVDNGDVGSDGVVDNDADEGETGDDEPGEDPDDAANGDETGSEDGEAVPSDEYAAFEAESERVETAMDGMSLAEMAAELDALAALADSLTDEAEIEQASDVLDGLRGRMSRVALSEYVDRISEVKAELADGVYGYTEDAAVLAAMGQKFDAIRDLEQYMTEQDIGSNAVKNGDELLDAVELYIVTEDPDDLPEWVVMVLLDVLGLRASTNASTNNGKSYEVSLEWIGDSSYCTLSEDNTVATWDFQGSPNTTFAGNTMGHMYDFRINLVFHDTSPDEFELTIPEVLYTRKCSGPELGVSNGNYVEYAIWTDDFIVQINNIESLSVEHSDRQYALRLNNVTSERISIPIQVRSYTYGMLGDRIINRNGWSYGFFDMVGGDGASVKAFDVDGTEYELVSRLTNNLYSLDVTSISAGSAYYDRTWTGYTSNRIYEWTDGIEEYYGISSEAFQKCLDDGFLLFEYNYNVIPRGWAPGILDIQVVPGNNGEVVSMQLGSKYNTWWYDKPAKLKEDWFVRSGADTIIFPMGLFDTHGNGLGAKDYTLNAGYAGTFYGRTAGSASQVTGFDVKVIVKYPVSDVWSSGMEQTDSSCTLNVTLRSDYCDDVISKTCRTRVVDPYVNSYSTGEIYFLSFDPLSSRSTEGAQYRFMDYITSGEVGLSSITSSFMKPWSLSGGASKCVSGEDKMTVGMAGLLAYDYKSAEWVELKSGYELRDISITYVIGAPIYNNAGYVIGQSGGDYDDSRKIVVEVIKSGGSTWEPVLETCYKNIETDVKNFADVLNSLDITKVRVVCESREVPVQFDISFNVYMGEKGNEALGTLVDAVREYGQAGLKFRAVAFVSATSESGMALANTEYISDVYNDGLVKMFSGMMGDEGYASQAPLINDAGFDLTSQSFYPGMMVVPTLYASDGSSLGAYYREPSSVGVAYVDWFISARVASYEYNDLGPELKYDPIYSTDDAVFRILIPEGMDVAQVYTGTCDALGTTDYLSGDVYMGTHQRVGGVRSALDGFSMEYSVDTNFMGTGRTVMTVKTNNPYTEKGYAPVFGGFTVRLKPANSDVVTSSDELALNVAAYCINKDGTSDINAYSGSLNGGSFKADNGAYFPAYRNVFGDLNNNENTNERIVIAHSFQCQILYNTVVSGIRQTVGKTGSNMWDTDLSIESGDPYTYRIVYSEMEHATKNVVLFSILEDFDTNTWAGTLQGFDMSDADKQGLTYTIYVTDRNLRTDDYYNRNVTEADLRTGMDGWHVYSPGEDLSGVKAVAVGFGSQEFAKDQAGKPSSVTVKLNMQAPDEGWKASGNVVQNRTFFSDVLVSTSEQPRSVLSNVVTTTVSYRAVGTLRISKTVIKAEGDDTGDNEQKYTLSVYYVYADGKQPASPDPVPPLPGDSDIPDVPVPLANGEYGNNMWDAYPVDPVSVNSDPDMPS